MALQEEATISTAADYWYRRACQLEAQLAQFEKVVVSTHPVVQHTLHVRRQDGTSEWVESGLGVYIRDDQA